MWLVGMVVCATLMLAGPAAMNAGHGSHSHAKAKPPTIRKGGKAAA